MARRSRTGAARPSLALLKEPRQVEGFRNANRVWALLFSGKNCGLNVARRLGRWEALPRGDLGRGEAEESMRSRGGRGRLGGTEVGWDR